MVANIFSRPTSFLQKSSCRVSNEKNILNSSVESCGVEKLDKSYIFVYFLTHFLFIINTVIRGAHDSWYTHVRYTEISKFDLLFFVYQYQYGHTRRAWYTNVRPMGISNFNLLCCLTLAGPKHFTRISKIMARQTRNVSLCAFVC